MSHTVESPPAERFPAYPASWYVFARSRRLRNGPLGKSIAGEDFVAVRSSSGTAVVFEGRCAHLGADLTRGRLIRDRLKCSFHGWEYALDGRCVRIPAGGDIPPRARLRTFPVDERHGLVVFFNRPRALFPFPPFTNEDVPLDAAPPLQFQVDAEWYMVGANAFDLQHFDVVHGRRLLDAPIIDCPDPFARRIRFTTKVIGRSVFDRALRRFVGGRVDIEITVWGGNVIVVRAGFQRVDNYILFIVHPIGPHTSLINLVALGRRPENPVARAVARTAGLWFRRIFTRAFVLQDLKSIGSARYRPDGLVAKDRALIDYFNWVCSLPRQGPDLSDRRT